MLANANSIIKKINPVISSGVHLGFHWVVAFNKEVEYWCGYMKLPVDHPWYKFNDVDRVVEVHGGLTFEGTRDFDDDPNNYWIGFDCAHVIDQIYLADQEYAEAQCKSMCEQANAALPYFDVNGREVERSRLRSEK